MRRLLVIIALGLGALGTGLPALARAPRPVMDWKPIRDASGREVPDDHLQGRVSVRGRITAENAIEAWRIDAVSPDGAAYDGFGTVCQDVVQGGDRSVDVGCEWKTASYPGGAPSLNDRYRLRLFVRSDGQEAHIGPDRAVTLVNPAAPPQDVRLAFDKAERRMSLSWAANPEPDVAHYRVEERVDSRPWTVAGEPEATTWERVVTEPGTYRYRLSAVRRVGDSGTAEAGPAAKPESPGRVVVTGSGSPPAESSGPPPEQAAAEGPTPPRTRGQAAPAPAEDPATSSEAPAEAAAAPVEPTPVATVPRSSPASPPDLLRGTATPNLRRPARAAPSPLPAPRPRPVPAPAVASPAPDPGYSLTLPYGRPQVVARAPDPAPAPPAAVASRLPLRPSGRSTRVPLGLAVLAASFLGLTAGLLQLGRSSLRAADRRPQAGAAQVSSLPGPGAAPLTERLRWLALQWRQADPRRRLDLLGDVLDIQLEMVALLGPARSVLSSGGEK